MNMQLRPSYEAINNSAPSAFDVECSERLKKFMAEASPQFTPEETAHRMGILATLTAIFEDWVRSVCLSQGLPPEMAAAAGGKVYTSGSYRLGFNEKSMDLDVCCVAPKMVTRHDFFDSLKVILEDHDSVENLSAIESAAVPMIAFEFDGVDIDLLFATVPIDSIPRDWDINDDNVLRGVDVGTEKSLNGPRVTNLIERLVPHFDSFLQLVRCVRYWAKKRGLYANKMGYLGGVNWNILSAFICQLYPNAAPALLLERFFFILRDWKWPTPILLTPQYDAGLGLESWDPSYGANRFHTMPILTPAYPSMNSSFAVSPQTLEVMVEEMASALERVRGVLAAGGVGWEEVFSPTDFAIAHSRYLAVEIYVTNLPDNVMKDKYNSWTGFCESRLRKLIEYLSYLPVCRLRLLPAKHKLLTVTDAQNGEGLSYLVGFDVDRNRMQGGELHLTNKVEGFKEELYHGAARSGIITDDVTHKQLRVKIVSFTSYRELPEECFASLGGKEKAREMHKQLRAARKKAAAEAEGLAPSDASLQDSASTAASDAPGSAAGAKRGLDGEGAGGASQPAAKKAASGVNGNGNVPLQREQSMGNGELIDGVAGRSGTAAGTFKLNLQ